MALYPLNPGIQPMGSFDILDPELALIKGGEVMTLVGASRLNTSSELAAPDVLDGYNYTNANLRVAATRASTAAQFPLALADDGTSPHYSTMYGRASGPLGYGQGAVIGPHTSAGSGKVTLWDKPGLYAVTLDSCAADFVASTVTDPAAIGQAIGFGSGADVGKLARVGCANVVAASGVGNLVRFVGDTSLVSTPGRLVGAGDSFTKVEIYFTAGMGVRTI